MVVVQFLVESRGVIRGIFIVSYAISSVEICKRKYPMATVEVEPLFVVGKDEDGFEVLIDVALMLASNEEIHNAAARAYERYFALGGQSSDKIRIRIMITDDESDIAGTAITPRGNEMIDPEVYSPDHEKIIARRMGPIPQSKT